MRLINTSTLELHDFSLSEIPPYAILSHTWGGEEVTCQDMPLSNRALKKGFAKIGQTCRLASERGLEFAWVDTCCIDKSSSAELTESINSMFEWYMNAAVCYVYLEDLRPDEPVEEGLPQCRWFTRGWTLQELLAPTTVEFYDMAWVRRGSKLDFLHTISRITWIPDKVLVGKTILGRCSVASRMSWAARRETARIEDMGYCLMEIFDEEIIKRNNDLTIFAWNTAQHNTQQLLGIFATSPAAFIDRSSIVPFAGEFINFSVTNKELFISGNIPLRPISVYADGDDSKGFRYDLFLGTDTQDSLDGGLYLRKLGPRIFCRDGDLPLAGFGISHFYQTGIFGATDYYILTDPISIDTTFASTFRRSAVHIPLHEVFTLEDVVPETLWDLTDRVFMRPKPYSWTDYSMVLAIDFQGQLLGRAVQLVVLCDFRDYRPIPVCKVFWVSRYSR